MDVAKPDAFSHSKEKKRSNKRPRKSGSTNDMREPPRRGSNSESLLSRDEPQSISSFQTTDKDSQSDVCNYCDPTKIGPQPQFASVFQEEFCRQQSFIQTLHMQNSHLLNENESLKLLIQEMRLQIQVQTVQLAMQIPELQSSTIAPILPDRAFMAPPKIVPLPQAAAINNVRTPYMGSEQMMAMKSLQVMNGSCEWEEIW